MNKIQLAALTIIFAVAGIELMEAENGCIKGWTKKGKGLCHPITAKDRAAAASKRTAALTTAVQANMANSTGQSLVDALNKRNMDLAADIRGHQDHIKTINSHRGKHAVLVKGKSKMRLNAASAQQKQEIRANESQISKDRQEINNNNMKLAAAQQLTNQGAASDTKNSLMDYLQQNSPNGQIDPVLLNNLNTALTAAYNQGSSDQYHADCASIETAYNQGYSDGQNGITPTGQDQSTNVNNQLQDFPYVSSCSDNQPAMCADGTNLALTICTVDGMAPDINGMCSDGNSVLCDDGINSPACSDGLPAM